MTKITGSEGFNDQEEALAFYKLLDYAGYSVELTAHPNGTYTVAYVGYTEMIPMDGIER